MAYIFMDESGDLGFDKSKARSSKNFLISIVIKLLNLKINPFSHNFSHCIIYGLKQLIYIG